MNTHSAGAVNIYTTRVTSRLWYAVTSDYDGADIDYNTASKDPLGSGKTEQEAIDDLMAQIEESTS